MKRCLALFLLSCFLKVQVHAFPTFENLPNNITINETLPVNSVVLEVASRSSDRGVAPYSLSCFPSRSFPLNTCEVFELTSTSVSIDSWRGFISLAQPLNSLANSLYTLALNAVDSKGQSKIGVLKIIIRATRLRPPVFSGATEVEIDQRISASQNQILEFSAVGTDSLSKIYSVNYRIQDGPFKDYFKIDPVLGRLSNLKPLTYSDPLIADGPISVTIQATYVINGNPAWDNGLAISSRTIKIFLKDQNLNSPTFDKTSYAGNIRETAEPNTAVNSVFFKVTDLDRSQTSASFSLTLDNYNKIFQIVPANAYKQLDARLTIKTNEFFNYNTGRHDYIFNVIATENESNEKKSTSVPVKVSIIQVNRFAPQFFENPYVAQLRETANAGAPVVTVKAWDRDVGDFGNTSIRYRFSTSAYDRFRMNTLSGEIRVANCRTPGHAPCLDFENNNLRNIRMIVWAVDQKGEGKTGSTTVVVNLQNDNDNKPTFAAETYFASIDDSSTTLSPLTPPTLATDKDKNVLVYSIESGNTNNAWSIDPNTGKITPNRPITYESAPINGTFELVIMASDGSSDTRSNVKIEVKPINRFTPLFSQLIYNVTIFETTPPGISIVDVVASDGDHPFTPGGQLIYRITSGSRQKFQINSAKGDISIIPGQLLNFRTDPSYILTVQVSDKGTPSISSEVQVFINLRPNRRYIGLSDKTTSIPDNESPNREVLELQAEMIDLGSDVGLEYSILETRLFDRNNVQLTDLKPTQLDMFRVDQRTGIVTVNKRLDGQNVSKWQAKIQVITDISPVLMDTGLVTILITISNKIPPSFNNPWTVQRPVYDMRVRQGDDFEEVAGIYTATPGNSSLFITYKLNDPQDFFELQSPTSGIIKQKRAIQQGSSNYQLTLTATDNGLPPLKSDATINVIVQATNQHQPIFVKSPYSAEIYDNATVGQQVIQVQATDEDKGDFGDVRYSIETNNSNFKIDETTGFISVSRSNFNALLEPRILLEIQAYDSPNNPTMRKFNFVYVNITVLDANNNAPIFQPSAYTFIIYTKEERGSDILRVSATDADVGENARLTYSIIERNDDGFFEIDSASGQIRLAKTLDRVEKNYTLTVEAADNGKPSLKGRSEVVFIVKILCEEKCNPIWTKPPKYLSSISVPETQRVGSVLARLEATSQTSRPLDFSFSRGGNITNLDKNFDSFSIVSGKQSNIANVTLLRKLDYNTRRNYELLLVARDSSVKNSETLRYLVVHVLPVKKFNPRFAFNSNNCPTPLIVKTPKGSSIETIVEEVKATPNHIFDIIEYKIPATPKVPFSVDQKGVITATEDLRSVKDYTFNIEANYNNTDNFKQQQQLCGGKDQSSVEMTVKVYDHFLSSPLSICYREDTNDGTILANLNDLLTEPSDSSRIQYVPAKLKGFEIREDGSVVLENIEKADENKDEIITINMNINLRGSTVRASPQLKPQKIISGTPLTLITLDSNLDDYNSQNKANLLRSLTMNTGRGKQCIVDAGFHTLTTGTVDNRRTDVYLYSFRGNTTEVITPMELDGIYGDVEKRQAAKMVGITDAASTWGGFNWQPVAIAMGLIIGLLLLALLFFCCFCCWGFCSQWCMGKSNDKEPMISRNTGLVNRAWSSQPVLQEEPHVNMQQGSINRGYPLDSPEIYPLPADSFTRRDDVTTVDGGAGSSVMGAPTGYVHIEAPLSRATSAFGARDEVDTTTTATLAAADSTAAAATTATTVTEKTETVVRQEYDHNHSGEGIYNNNSYTTSKTSAGARAYSSKSGGLDDINEGDDQQPVQLNDTSVPGSSQIGAVLIRPETPRGLGYTQRIVGGAENMPEQQQMTSYDYSNFEEGTLSLDPSRLNMAMQNEVMSNGMTTRNSYYDETIGAARQTDLQMNNYAAENTFEQFEETRYL